MEQIEKVTDTVKSKIKALSAYSLPDNPSARGKSAADIKKAFFEPIVYGENNVIDEIDRVVDEANAALEELDGEIGSDALTTTAQTLVGAINENKTAIDQNKTAISTNKGAIGTLADLKTKDKSSLVGAINENKDGIANRDQAIATLQDRLTGYETVVEEHEENKKAIEENRSAINGHEVAIKQQKSRMDQYASLIQGNKENITTLEKRLDGTQKSYVLNTFAEFIRLLEFDIYLDFIFYELLTGDRIFIVEEGVPDFWFEQTDDEERVANAGTYVYQGKEYSLAAKFDLGDGVYDFFGIFHILESDFGEVKEALQKELSGKVDKIQNVSNNIYVYAESPGKGTILYGTSLTADKSTIPIRVEGGAVAVGTPTNDAHAINLKHLTDNYGTHEERIASIEAWLDKQDDVIVESSDSGYMDIPSGMQQYAQILEIHGCESAYRDEYYYWQIERNFPQRIETDTGMVLFEMPSNWYTLLPHFGVRGNYIYFDGDKVYYKQTTKIESYQYDPEAGESIVADYSDTTSIVRLALPIITDITDILNIDPVFDRSVCNSINVIPRYSEDDIYGMTCEGGAYEYQYNMPKIKIAFEKA